jgi:hypothetical protein
MRLLYEVKPPVTNLPADDIITSPGTDADSLSATVRINRNAPIGETQFSLLQGGRIRARLPFNITATTPTPAPSGPCPVIKIVPATGFINRDGRDVMKVFAEVRRMPFGMGALSYKWSAGGVLSIVGADDTQSIELTRSTTNGAALTRSVVSVVVRGPVLPPGCSNQTFYSPEAATGDALVVTVEPQSITVCPSNPNLNNPPDSTVLVTVNTNMMIDIMVSDGKTSARGVSRANYPMYDWNLSGMAPGTYTATARPAVAAPAQAGASTRGGIGTVTVKGCPAATTVTGEQTGVPDTTTASVQVTTAQIERAINNLFTQAATVDVKRQTLFNNKMLTADEDASMRQSLSRLKDALSILKGKLSPTEPVPDAGTKASLYGLLTPVGSAVQELDDQSLKMTNESARQDLRQDLLSLRLFYGDIQKTIKR